MLREPQRFGKYLLLDRISVGGMAEVFKAKAFGVEGFEKILAIKRILPTMVEDSDFIEMFIDEAKISGQLNHANICQIFELGRFEKAHYIAMEYISGKDLLQINNHHQRQRQAVPISVACFIIAKLCEGLDYAHRKADAGGNPLNIIHRDVSPQNVLVSFEGEVKLIDFGIAKARYRSSKTAAGVLKGKFGYMSPEQVRGLRLDRRSDVFSLGTLLYEMVTGSRLFGGDTDFAVLEKVRNGDITPPSRLNSQIDPEFERVILQSLARTPEGRYQWANELQEALQGIMLRHKPLMTTKRLSAWMKEHFSEDIQRERDEHERFLAMGSSYAAEPPAPPPTHSLPDFDEYDDDEETALMKQHKGSGGGGESDFQDIETLAQTPGARGGPVPMAEIEDLDDDGQEGEDATVILWGQDDEDDDAPGENATMILPDDGLGLPEDATMMLPPDEDDDAPGENATMILDEDGDAGATMILPDEEGGGGLSIAQVKADAAAANAAAMPAPAVGVPAAAPAPAVLPGGLPPPREEEDPFGLNLPSGPTAAADDALAGAPAKTTDTAKTVKPKEPSGLKVIHLVMVGIGAAIVAGLLVALLTGGSDKPAKAPPASGKAAVVLLLRAKADVTVSVKGQDPVRTRDRGAVLIEELEPGEYEVEFTAKGYHPTKEKFEVKAGQMRLLGPYVLKGIAKPSTLQVVLSDLFKDAAVTVGGRLIPMLEASKPIPLPMNKKVELRVSMLGYVDHVEQIDAGHDKVIRTKTISLVEDRNGQASIKTTPSGATVWVNGKKQSCVTPCRVVKLHPKKKFKVRLKLSGYKTHVKTYKFEKFERVKTIIVSLTQLASLGILRPADEALAAGTSAGPR